MFVGNIYEYLIKCIIASFYFMGSNEVKQTSLFHYFKQFSLVLVKHVNFLCWERQDVLQFPRSFDPIFLYFV